MSADQPEIDKRYIHSDIYERLVDDDEDLVGLVAYGLYQSAKRRWITDFESANGKTPSEAEVKAFCFTYNDDILNNLVRESDDLIFRVTEERIKSRIDEISATAFNQRTVGELATINTTLTTEFSKTHNAIGKLRGYKHHVIGHILGFLTLVGASAILLLIVKYGEPSIDFILIKLGLLSS